MSFFLGLAVLVGLLALPSFGLTFETEPCFLQIPGAATTRAECGTLQVPENPADPAGTRLELFVARVPALTAKPRPDPLLLIAGGPGQSTVDFYLSLRAAFEPTRTERDLILIDQRGTGRSTGGLTCPMARDLVLEAVSAEQLPARVDACLEAVQADPRFYTTSLAVADLEALRQALDIDAWNLYGVSYGTRVAQHYLRRYPSATRSLILDGVVPATIVLGPDIAGNAQASLDAVFSRCSADPACKQRFGDLPQRFTALLEALARSPTNVDIPDPRSAEKRTVQMSADSVRAAVRLLSYDPRTVALLPLLISEAHAGDLRPLAAQTAISLDALAGGLSFPMHNSVACTEDVPFFNSVPAARETYLGDTVLEALRAICARWPRGVMDPDLHLPLGSDRPVLMLSGENDPITPPHYAHRAIAEGLDHAVHLIGAGQGHGLAAVGCVPRLMRAFLENPEPALLEASCLARLEPTPIFESFLGPAP